ncbi:hypothetical protein DLH72_00615 [Candidatus Gracilibacteria bacterium]|nr:MAG: hypothetical protein DLH72_00615 [Candidatus Gracilibacteria bacterium]
MENKNLDILLELERELFQEEIEKQELKNNYIYQTIIINDKKEKKSNKNLFSGALFIFKYTATSLLIFGVLLIGTNYNAYINIAKGFLFKGEYEKESESILSSVEASNIKEKTIEKEEKKAEKLEEEEKKSSLSIKKYKKELDEKNISLSIEITPYENRIVIPKLGKNIPLVDIKNQKVDSEHELENIFMKELENGVVRYPGSAVPGENGNSFIFGHSSNFPWMNGDYNEVFSNLNFLESGDEVIIYYGQKKFIYKIKEKKVIKPGDVSVLKRYPDKKELSIMTCWPIGTTLNRLVVIGEMIEEN